MAGKLYASGLFSWSQVLGTTVGVLAFFEFRVELGGCGQLKQLLWSDSCVPMG